MGRDLLSRLVFVVWNDVFSSNADVVSLNGERRWQVMALSQSVVCAVGAKSYSLDNCFRRRYCYSEIMNCCGVNKYRFRFRFVASYTRVF